MTILVTGGAGFIGSNFVLDWVRNEKSIVINVDKLTYAGNLYNLTSLEKSTHHHFVRGDIGDSKLINLLFRKYQPRALVHFAAESHVDRSILGPEDFIQTNIVGTFRLLETTRAYWQGLPKNVKNLFRFINISTDEVYGSLGYDDPAFSETTRYAPNSPYSASKAASDHLARAYFHTYGLPVITSNCSNNYGPYQFPEKLIPLMIINAITGKPLPVYGEGKNVRDWLYVTDHCSAIRQIIKKGCPGETYNIGGKTEKLNIEVVKTMCNLLDELRPKPDGSSYSDQIIFVQDRPGHDLRYAIDTTKIERDLNWQPHETFESGLSKTIKWYLDNGYWIDKIISKEYKNWINLNYGQRMNTK